jgi:imidazoleglycerol phosphate dehydratase HisB
VVEDVGLVLGRALKEILVLRMEHWGVYGAGSSLDSRQDLEQPIRVALSVEGRKCWKLVPGRDSYDQLRKRFLIGHEVCGELYSEDLDDFLDGLSGGLGCSIMVHFEQIVDPAEGWPLLFAGLGKAVHQAFEPNPYRRGVPPGVKATLS